MNETKRPARFLWTINFEERLSSPIQSDGFIIDDGSPDEFVDACSCYAEQLA